MDARITQAAKHLNDILRDAICVQPGEKAWVIYDTEAPLTRILTEAYRLALPEASFTDFAELDRASFMARLDTLQPKDLVILVQSTNFRLDEFRIRIELFRRNLKTMEFIHLSRMPESEWDVYIEALTYNKDFLRGRGRKLKQHIDVAKRIEVDCIDTKLVYDTAMEETKLNVGDYSELTNVGGTFPIGEVFSEPKDFSGVNGKIRIFGYAGEDHIMRIVKPFVATITEGILETTEAPQEFQNILEKIRGDESVIVREFGLGLNEAMSQHRIVSDITAFERQKGLHLSLGEKHATYNKPGMNRKSGRFHVDIFIDITKITIDDTIIYQNGDFTV